jgi:hypothetical protein
MPRLGGIYVTLCATSADLETDVAGHKAIVFWQLLAS